ncbi:DNA polymerase delta catalytic subunit [Trypanosoma grayi]|uniref:DNA polymerase delta catalytic subunit n=1 Tax=Trypanosoma grayi TaxID=71804 RepID=UPI0004F3F4DB|nr:DNA polymerase delta catalytic subunit [Trypanosoma grayi]KEG11952.1 DNA polymerase delta catalytic subunit [Trypanosoma grayi]
MSQWASLSRPPPPADYLRRDLLFQLLDCCQTKGSAHNTVSSVRHAENPIVRLYGVTAEGHSVLVHCYNYEPYLWIKAPQGWLPVYTQTLMNELNTQLDTQTHATSTVVRIEVHKRQSIMHYQSGGLSDHLKIVVQLPQHIPKLRSLLSDRGVACAGAWEGVRVFSTFESNVIFPLRFLVDHGLGGCNWITVPAEELCPATVRTSTCQIEVCCSHEAVHNHEAVGQYLSIAPFRILSVDIECQGRKGLFPEPEKDPVIQIANHCINYGNETEPLTRTVFTLKSCGAIAGAQVCSYETETEMLLAWVRFVKAIDPDILTGYNICNFDFPYLLNRGVALKINDAFHYWGRQINERTVPREKKFQSKQMGNREYTELTLEGRVIMDAMVVIQRDFKLRSYSLNAVSQNFLGEQKEDVHHSIIADLQNGSEETRRRLAVYCLKDALLPVKLLERLMVMVNNVEMARVTGVPIGWLLERGQQIKVFSMMLRKAKSHNLVVPVVEYSGNGGDQRGYEGATVIEPVKGFYNCPIATLDFASLYPSIIIAHNLCYSTLVRPAEVVKYPPEMLTRSPTGDTFVRKELFPGILPEVLQGLLAARKHAKSLMKDVPMGSLEYKVLNGRQLALKLSANSVYGFTGAQVGKLPCLEVSSSVTAYGRQMIDQTKSIVESIYKGVKVVYGDTDSVMIKCVTDETQSDTERLRCAMDFGKEAAEQVSQHFLKPIKLEFEKVYFPYLLMNKKRYAGLLWTNTERYDKLDAKGIETVRRDNCPLVASIISGVLNRIIIQRSVESAVEFVKGTIRDLLLNRLDISHLVITKAFSKAEDEYVGAQAHVALVERMRKRDPASAPNVGDRVAYVIIRAAKGAKAYERSEDPIYVLDNNIPIDTQYYLEHQLAPPLLRVFEGVLDDPSVLIKGEHTRHIAVTAPSKNAGGLMKFVKFQLQCISCRTIIKEGALCDVCRPKEPEVYGRIVAKRNHYEAIYSQVWTQCQQCQGSLNQEVICTSRDCPVFYMRKKVQKDVREQQLLLDRFGVVDDW